MTSTAREGAGQPQWQGVFAILCTPFTSDGQLDIPSLEREIHFCLEAQTHGLVALVNASEYWTLSDEERAEVAELTIKQVSGSVPVIIGVTSGSADWSLNFARHAQDSGADGVIAMPPTGRPTSELETYRYYEKLSSVLDIPMFVQNHEPPLGTRMSPALVSRIVRELPHADWVKEETLPAGHAISVEIASCGPKLAGVMGGIAGRYLFDEYARGVCGTMPGLRVRRRSRQDLGLAGQRRQRSGQRALRAAAPTAQLRGHFLRGVQGSASVERRDRVRLRADQPVQPSRRVRPSRTGGHSSLAPAPVCCRSSPRGPYSC